MHSASIERYDAWVGPANSSGGKSDERMVSYDIGV